MSASLDSTPTPPPSQTTPPGPSVPASAAPARRLGPSPWLWMVLGCALVSASGLVRVNQERLFADAALAAERSPFSMRDLPRQLGPPDNPTWQMVGEELELEPMTLQIAGCSDYMYRSYVDRRTGVAVRVLVAFGPAMKVYPHSPVVCFPANGFQYRGGPWTRVIPGGEQVQAPFHGYSYGKSAGGVDDLQEVYYSYWHDGRWSPIADASERMFRHRPAMFKVQVERPVVAGEAGVADGPIEDFLRHLVPEIERRMAVAAESDRVEA